jgi:hypothetical protein
MKISFRKISAVVAAGMIIVSAAACASSASAPPAPTGLQKETNAQTQDSNNLDSNQPVPVFKFSQARQTEINVEEIEANGENTTSFGVSNNGQLVWQCSSIGMPVPAADELTNPDQQVKQPDGGGYNLNNGDNVIAQPDPTGVYTGDTTGTNTLCVSPSGQQYIQYWEGYTDAVSGPASWVNGHVVLQGTPDALKQVPANK